MSGLLVLDNIQSVVPINLILFTYRNILLDYLLSLYYSAFLRTI